MKDTAFIEIDQHNVVALVDLRVRKRERHLIAANAYWIAQAALMDSVSSYGIFFNNSPAGLLSLMDPRLERADPSDSHFYKHCLFVWRLMIDRKHRGKSLGSHAIDFALQQALAKGFDGLSLTTMDRHPNNALAFYEKLGFKATGRRLDDEIELSYFPPRKRRPSPASSVRDAPECWIETLDESQLHQVHLLMQGEWWCAERSLSEARTVIAESDLILAGVDSSGCVTAFLRVLTDRVAKALIFDVIVRPDRRDAGLGSQLMQRALQHPALKSVKSIELYCPAHMSGFYQQLGFSASESQLQILSR